MFTTRRRDAVRPLIPDGQHRAKGCPAGEGVLREDLPRRAIPHRQICRGEQISEHHRGRVRSQGRGPLILVLSYFSHIVTVLLPFMYGCQVLIFSSFQYFLSFSNLCSIFMTGTVVYIEYHPFTSGVKSRCDAVWGKVTSKKFKE